MLEQLLPPLAQAVLRIWILLQWVYAIQEARYCCIHQYAVRRLPEHGKKKSFSLLLPGRQISRPSIYKPLDGCFWFSACFKNSAAYCKSRKSLSLSTYQQYPRWLSAIWNIIASVCPQGLSEAKSLPFLNIPLCWIKIHWTLKLFRANVFAIPSPCESGLNELRLWKILSNEVTGIERKKKAEAIRDDEFVVFVEWRWIHHIPLLLNLDVRTWSRLRI